MEPKSAKMAKKFRLSFKKRFTNNSNHESYHRCIDTNCHFLCVNKIGYCFVKIKPTVIAEKHEKDFKKTLDYVRSWSARQYSSEEHKNLIYLPSKRFDSIEEQLEDDKKKWYTDLMFSFENF